MARTIRFILCAAAAFLPALVVRHDRRCEEAQARSLAALIHAGAPRECTRPRSVRLTLEDAGPAGLSLAFQLLGDPEPRVRASAAAYLGLRRSRLAVPRLIRLLRDRHPFVRRAAANALGTIADPRALPFLERAMASDELVVAQAALRAARRIHATRQLPADS